MTTMDIVMCESLMRFAHDDPAALCWATKQQNVHMLQTLLRRSTQFVGNALTVACEVGKPESLRILLDHHRPSQSTMNNLLLDVCGNGHSECFDILIGMIDSECDVSEKHLYELHGENLVQRVIDQNNAHILRKLLTYQHLTINKNHIVTAMKCQDGNVSEILINDHRVSHKDTYDIIKAIFRYSVKLQYPQSSVYHLISKFMETKLSTASFVDELTSIVCEYGNNVNYVTNIMDPSAQSTCTHRFIVTTIAEHPLNNTFDQATIINSVLSEFEDSLPLWRKIRPDIDTTLNIFYANNPFVFWQNVNMSDRRKTWYADRSKDFADLHEELVAVVAQY